MNKYLIILLTTTIMISGCNSDLLNANKSEQTTVVNNDGQRFKYEVVQAHVADDADKDKRLGTKHIVIIDGVPYAELDGAERFRVSSNGISDNSIEDIENAVNQVFGNNDNKEDGPAIIDTEPTEDTKEAYNVLINNFETIVKSYSSNVSKAKSSNAIKLLGEYGLSFDKNDRILEAAIAEDTANTCIYELIIYEDKNGKGLDEISIKKSFGNNAKLNVIDDTATTYFASIATTIDGKADQSIIDARAFDKNGTKFILATTYLESKQEAAKKFEEIVKKFK